MGTIVFGNFMCISGLLVGLTKGWSLALVILGCFPIISFGLHVSGKALNAGTI